MANKTKITIAPENPLVKWYKASSSDKFKTLAPEEREAARQQFVAKFSEHPDEEAAKERAKALDFATRDLKNDVFNDPEFQTLDTKDQIEYIRANMYATGRLDPQKEKERQSKGKLYKFFNPLSSRDLAAEEYDKYYNAAIEASIRAPFTTGVKQAYAAATGNEDLSRKTQEEVQKLETLQKRAPVGAAIAEAAPQAVVGIGAGLATGGAAALPFLARLGVGALFQGVTAPVTSVERVPEGSSVKELQAEKIRTGETSAALSLGGDVLTSPQLRQAVGAVGRTVGAPVSRALREAGIGRELADEVQKPILNSLREELNAEAVAKGILPDNISAYTDKKLASPEFQKRLVDETQAVLSKQRGNLFASDTVYTAAAANSPELRRVQANVGNLDEILETSLERTLPKLTSEAKDTIETMKRAGIVPVNQESVAPLQLKVYDKFVKPFVGEAAAAKDVTIKALDKSFKEAQTNIIKQARGGVLAGKSNITPKETLKKFKEVAKAIPVNELDVLKGSNVYQVVENLAKKPGNRTFTFSELANLQQRLADDMTNSGPAAQSFEEMFKVLNNSLGEANDATLTQLSQLGTDYVSNKATALASLTKESQINKRLTGMPILRAISEGKGAEDIAKAVRTEGLSTKELEEILKDKEILGAVRGAVLADVADTLSLNTGKVDADTFYKVYGDSVPTLQKLFAGDKKFLSLLSDISEVGKQTSAARGFAGRGGATAAQEGSGVKQTAASAAAELTGARGVSAGLFGTTIEQRLHKKTIEAVKDSINDKFLAARFFNVAKKTSAGDLNYKTLWNKGQGIRAAATGAGKAIAVSPEGLEDKPRKPLAPVFPEDKLPISDVSSMGITNTGGQVGTPSEDTSSVERLKTSGIIESEGIEPLAYDDTEGNRTAGIGFNMDTPNATKVWELAGIGKNFEDVYNRKAELTEPEAMKLAQASFKIAMDDANAIFPNFETLPEDKQDALLHLSYQLGAPRLRKFRKLRAAVANEDFAAAAEEVMNSELPKQTPNRAAKITDLLYPAATQSKSKRIKYDSKGNKLG